MEGACESRAREGKGADTKAKRERDWRAGEWKGVRRGRTGKEAHARKSAEVLAAYARVLKRIPDTNDAPLLAGLEGFKIVYAL